MCLISRPKSKSRKSKSKRSNISTVSSSSASSQNLAPRIISVADSPRVILSNDGTQSVSLPISVPGATFSPRTLHDYTVKTTSTPGNGYGHNYGALGHNLSMDTQQVLLHSGLSPNLLSFPAAASVIYGNSGAVPHWGWNQASAKPDGTIETSKATGSSTSSAGQTQIAGQTRAVNEAQAEELIKEVDTARRLAERLDEVGELRGGRALRESALRERSRERGREREVEREQQRERDREQERDVTARIALDMARRNEMGLEMERFRRERERDREHERMDRLASGIGGISGVVANALAAERERDNAREHREREREVARLGSGGVNVYLPAPTCGAAGRERRRSSATSLGIPISVARRVVERLGKLEGRVWEMGMNMAIDGEREREDQRWFGRRVGMGRVGGGGW